MTWKVLRATKVILLCTAFKFSAMASTKTNTKGSQPSSAVNSALNSLWGSYQQETSPRLKLVDAFLVFIMLSGIAQFLYCILVINYPFNAFLAGSVSLHIVFLLRILVDFFLYRFASTIGQFVLTASLRSQVNPENKVHFASVSPER